VPGYDSLLRMSRILLAERVPANGRVLVVGAGGGLELEDMALAHPGWRFDGVDPSQPMLDLAAQRLQSAGVAGDRVALHRGYVQSAPAGPFDGATCLLTFHFVPREERVPMAAEIRRRLKPGAPLVVAHLSVADGAGLGGRRAGSATYGCHATPRFRWRPACRPSMRPGRGTRLRRSWRC
jgi:tRNA (cmo5U34)-methyltransferase